MSHRPLGRLFSAAAPVVAIAWLTSACASVPPDRREEVRNTLDAEAEAVIADFVAADPDLQQALDDAVGYFVADFSGAMAAAVGSERGRGVLYDKAAGTRTYMKVRRYRLGVGVGVTKIKSLVVIETPEALARFRKGVWKTSASTGRVVGESMVSHDSTPGSGFKVFTLSEAGAELSTTLRVAKISADHDLTDVGVSGTPIPNTGFEGSGRQEEGAPRVWPHKLPFLAQKVIDQGYDLPLPYGVGLTYTDIVQDQSLTGLEVAFNNVGEKEPFEFVAFDNAVSDTQSAQLKLDAWVLPFMNVFGILGTARGSAPMDVILDGNLMLEEIGTDCSRPVQPTLCRLLQDRTFVLPINPDVDVDNYGFGVILAGGWKGWFVTIPANITWVEPAGTVTDGNAITVTPRFGRVFSLGGSGTLAVFAGGNYLDTELTIDGSFTQVGEDLVINYRIQQKNPDKWNLLLGLNWEMSSRWSLSAEYDGFEGSREAFITNLGYRF